ncbi:hypothetical protein YWY31_03700 [Paenibacillus illinoisensis]
MIPAESKLVEQGWLECRISHIVVPPVFKKFELVILEYKFMFCSGVYLSQHKHYNIIIFGIK